MPDQKRDYYEVLEVPKGASEDELKKAYRRLAKDCHPDLHPGDKEAEMRFKELGEAYAVLSDKDKRTKYDQYGHAGVDPNFGAGGGFSGFGNEFDLGSIFESFFGGGFGGATSARRAGPARGESIRTNLMLAFEEAAFGCDKEIALTRVAACANCHGSGAAAGSRPETCSSCRGTGQVRTVQRTPFGNIASTAACSVCDGRGQVIDNPCASCRGTGVTRGKATLSVKVPAGVDDGQTISLRGQGNAGAHGGPAGDLLVDIHVRPHPFFTRDGTTVHVEYPVTFSEAALGADIEVSTLDGKVRYTVPEGTQNGTVFRLKGKGIPSLHGGTRGDQFVHIAIEIPKNLNKKQKQLLQDFAQSVGEANHPQRKSFLDKLRKS